MAFGPAAGLELVDALASRALAEDLPPAAQPSAATSSSSSAVSPKPKPNSTRAATLTRNARERDLLLDRAQASEERWSPD